jgi:hypothetical protein
MWMVCTKIYPSLCIILIKQLFIYYSFLTFTLLVLLFQSKLRTLEL